MKIYALLLPLLSLGAAAQAVYIDIGPAGAPIPPSTFAGASSQPGVWNGYVPNTGGVANLVDLNGQPSGISLTEAQIGGVASNGDTLFNTGVTLDSGHLLRDGVRLAQGSTSPVITRWTFSGLTAGNYRLRMFGFGPSIHLYYTQFQVFQGATPLTGVLYTQPESWTGSFVEGSTHVTAYVPLTQATNSIMVEAMCWSSFSDWGAVNGFQLERYSACGDPAVNYCTAGLSSNGCTASISASGSASASAASGYPISVTGVEGQRSGMIFYGVQGELASTWHPNSSSLVCVRAPRQRTPIQNTGGTLNACDGTLTLDWNAFRATHPAAVGQPFVGGEAVFAQAWYRDGAAPGKANLSDAIVFGVCP